MKKSYYVYPATLLCDFYKVGHIHQYPAGTECVYSNWTARGSRIEGVDNVVAFGLQAFIKKFLINYFNKHFFSRTKDEVVQEYARYIKYTLGVENPDASHISKLHDLGYLPLRIRAVKEGTVVPVRVPMITVESTHPDFFWLTNYVESIMSAELWGPSTTATIALEYRKILEHYARLTGADTGFVRFQGHDFSYRGMFGHEAAALGGAGHLTSFYGTDTIPAIGFMEEYYNANIEKELIGTSVNATEHSVMCAGGEDDEFETYRRLIQDVYPKGILSIVSDTWDLWAVLTDILPRLKGVILDRDGKVVIRPDSGDPVEILCGDKIIDLTNDCENLEACQEYMQDILVDSVRKTTPHGEHGAQASRASFKFQGKYYTIKVDINWNRHDRKYYFVDGSDIVDFKEVVPTPEQLGVIEVLWNVFGGKINDKGFKELDPHIGAIYGDAITLERCKEICQRLMDKGFASTNVVFGIGSFTYQFNTRDTFKFAMKATHVVINGEEKNIQKNPATDKDKTKKSATGRLVVVDSGHITWGKEPGIPVLIDGLTIAEQKEREHIDMLENVFIDGVLVRDETLTEIRARIDGAV